MPDSTLNNQYNNTVEAFSNSSNDNIQNKKNEKNSSINNDKKQLGIFFVILLYCIGTVITISYMGANLLFYKWALQPLTRCSSKKYSNLFDIVFPTECNEPICTGKTKQSSSGGGNSGITECIIENNDIKDFCKFTLISGLESKNPVVRWLKKSYKLSNVYVNSVIKNIISNLPSGDLCGVTFLLGFIIIPIIITLVVPVVSFVAMFVNVFKEAFGAVFSTNFSHPLIHLLVGIFLVILAFLFSLPISSIYSVVLPIIVMAKLLLYPVMMGGKDTLLKIVGKNLFLINIMVWLSCLITVIYMSNIVSKNIYIGIMIAYIPLSLLYLYKIFT